MSSTGTFHLVVASVGETRFDGAALSATIPTTSGVITILPHHEALVATLQKGTITIRETLETKTVDIEGGVIEVANDRAVVLL